MLTRAGLRSFSTRALKVVNDVAKQQFSISMHGEEAVLAYEQTGNTITFVNTNVPEVFQGKGIGKLLAKHAFDHAKKKNYDVVCQCHFLAKYYQNNIHEYKNLKVKLESET